jgi:hypothetical protein
VPECGRQERGAARERLNAKVGRGWPGLSDSFRTGRGEWVDAGGDWSSDRFHAGHPTIDPARQSTATPHAIDSEQIANDRGARRGEVRAMDAGFQSYKYATVALGAELATVSEARFASWSARVAHLLGRIASTPYDNKLHEDPKQIPAPPDERTKGRFVCVRNAGGPSYGKQVPCISLDDAIMAAFEDGFIVIRDRTAGKVRPEVRSGVTALELEGPLFAGMGHEIWIPPPQQRKGDWIDVVLDVLCHAKVADLTWRREHEHVMPGPDRYRKDMPGFVSRIGRAHRDNLSADVAAALRCERLAAPPWFFDAELIGYLFSKYSFASGGSGALGEKALRARLEKPGRLIDGIRKDGDGTRKRLFEKLASDAQVIADRASWLYESLAARIAESMRTGLPPRVRDEKPPQLAPDGPDGLHEWITWHFRQLGREWNRHTAPRIIQIDDEDRRWDYELHTAGPWWSPSVPAYSGGDDELERFRLAPYSGKPRTWKAAPKWVPALAWVDTACVWCWEPIRSGQAGRRSVTTGSLVHVGCREFEPGAFPHRRTYRALHEASQDVGRRIARALEFGQRILSEPGTGWTTHWMPGGSAEWLTYYVPTWAVLPDSGSDLDMAAALLIHGPRIAHRTYNGETGNVTTYAERCWIAAARTTWARLIKQWRTLPEIAGADTAERFQAGRLLARRDAERVVAFDEDMRKKYFVGSPRGSVGLP